MSAPRSRRLRNQTAPHTVAKRDRGIAIGGSVAMVVFTAILIWLMRPGKAFYPGTGGLITRQPRATWLVVVVLAAIGGSYWLVKRPTAKWKKPALVGAICAAVIVIMAPLAATQWSKDGTLRHYTTQPTEATTTTVKGATTTTQKPSLTTVRATTTPTAGSSTTIGAATTTGATTTVASTPNS